MIVLIFILLPISAVLFLTEKYLNSNYNKDWKPQQAHLFGHALQYNTDCLWFQVMRYLNIL